MKDPTIIGVLQEDIREKKININDAIRKKCFLINIGTNLSFINCTNSGIFSLCAIHLVDEGKEYAKTETVLSLHILFRRECRL